MILSLCRRSGVLAEWTAWEALPGAVPYQCSGNTLRESFPTGGSDQLTRIAAS